MHGTPLWFHELVHGIHAHWKICDGSSEIEASTKGAGGLFERVVAQFEKDRYVTLPIRLFIACTGQVKINSYLHITTSGQVGEKQSKSNDTNCM